MDGRTRYKIRALTTEDQALLWEVLYLSLFVPEGAAPFERAILDRPDLSKYVRDWGRAGDAGLVAVGEDGRPLGAIWLRLLTGDQRGYGHVDDSTPELGMAVFPEFRGRGVGSSLLARLIETAGHSYEQISLSVARENPALRLYGRFGFEPVAEDGASLTMLKKLKVRHDSAD